VKKERGILWKNNEGAGIGILGVERTGPRSRGEKGGGKKGISGIVTEKGAGGRLKREKDYVRSEKTSLKSIMGERNRVLPAKNNGPRGYPDFTSRKAKGS